MPHAAAQGGGRLQAGRGVLRVERVSGHWACSLPRLAGAAGFAFMMAKK